MDLEYLHLMRDDSMAFAYYHFSLAAITDLTFDVLKSLKRKESVADIAAKYGLSVVEVNNVLTSVEELLVGMDTGLNIVGQENNRIIDRITLHVSNDCNLRCKYCYAGGGNYSQERNLMSIETADKFVKFCIGNFDKINSVVFFGGEPMLNIPVMERVCRLFKRYFEDGLASFLPQFGIITNGTILNDRVVTFIKENISYVTVSIDGDKEVNDANRVFANGAGSYDKIVHFIRSLQRNTNVQVSYEATFTQSHISLDYTHKKVNRLLAKEFGIHGTVVDELSLEDDLGRSDSDLVDYDGLLENDFESLPSGFGNILWALVKKTSMQMCAVAKHTFAVSVDGDMYPCHMKVGEEQNYLGNIQSDNIFNSPDMFYEIPSDFSLKNNDKCEHCWAMDLCGGCAVKWFYDVDDKTFKKYPNKELCDFHLNEVEKILIAIGRIRKDKLLWDALLKKIYQKNV